MRSEKIKTDLKFSPAHEKTLIVPAAITPE